MHDGVMLPRAFRRAGFSTDFFDATDIADCRMYQGLRQTWNGLSKNATEGMASVMAIVPWTIILLGGQVLPWIIVAMALFERGKCPMAWLFLTANGTAALAGLAVRWIAALRFKQDRVAALFHPIGIVILLAIQWYALIRKLVGCRPIWRGRSVKLA